MITWFVQVPTQRRESCSGTSSKPRENAIFLWSKPQTQGQYLRMRMIWSFEIQRHVHFLDTTVLHNCSVTPSWIRSISCKTWTLLRHASVQAFPILVHVALLWVCCIVCCIVPFSSLYGSVHVCFMYSYSWVLHSHWAVLLVTLTL